VKRFRIVDLSHPIRPDLPVWPGDPPTSLQPAATLEKSGYTLNRLTIGEHSGTHAGAPCHLIPDAMDMASIPASSLVLPAVKLEVRELAATACRFLLSPEDVQRWEKKHGLIMSGAAVLIETGWSAHWHDPGRYYSEKFPGLDLQTVENLGRRGITAVGIDSPGIDGGGSRDFAANRALAANGMLHLENLTGLREVPEKDAWIFIGALPIVGGSGSPARILAMVPDLDE